MLCAFVLCNKVKRSRVCVVELEKKKKKKKKKSAVREETSDYIPVEVQNLTPSDVRKFCLCGHRSWVNQTCMPAVPNMRTSRLTMVTWRQSHCELAAIEYGQTLCYLLRLEADDSLNSILSGHRLQYASVRSLTGLDPRTLSSYFRNGLKMCAIHAPSTG